MLMEFLHNMFDTIQCSFIKCLLNRSIRQTSTIEFSLLNCIYQKNNKTMLLSFEQTADTTPNSPFLIYWIIYLVYHIEEIVMRFCQFRSINCQIAQIIV